MPLRGSWGWAGTTWGRKLPAQGESDQEPACQAILLVLVADSYCETLPIDGPPSFRGQSVKYVYKLTIGCQRVNSPIKLLRVPFRVLVLHGKPTRCPALPRARSAARPADSSPPLQASRITSARRMRPSRPQTPSWRRRRA